MFCSIIRTSDRRNSSTLARRLYAAVAACALLAATPAARAQTSETSQAEILFEQGRAQMARGDYVGACPKFEESYRLDPANGTLLGLALCHEEQGRWASAWTEFQAVAAAAVRDGRANRAAVAREHIASLEPKVSKLTIDLSAETRGIPSLDIECDGVHVESAAGDLEVPVDPGTHLIRASAPGHTPWTTSVRIGVRSERARVQVPPLATLLPVPVAPASLPPAQAVPVEPDVRHLSPPELAVRQSSRVSVQRVLGIVLVGLGAVATGVGAWEGLHAIAENDDARSRCPTSPCANVTGLALNQSAFHAATASDVLLGAGALTVVVGASLWSTAPRAPVSLSLGLRSAQLRLVW